MKIIAIIPARLNSSRLPEKVLLDIGGKSMLQRVYEKLIASSVFDHVIIATDHKDVMEHCSTYSMECRITSDSHFSGTDRVAEVAESIESDIVINVQADEPFLKIQNIVILVELMKRNGVQIGTLAKGIESTEDLFDYNIVKVVKEESGRALYFSRQAIPSQRETPYRKWMDKASYFHHIGLYGFRREVLLQLTNLDVHPLEVSENLEQLRWMANGYTIHVAEVTSDSFGIDTEEDLIKARAIFK